MGKRNHKTLALREEQSSARVEGKRARIGWILT